MYFSDHAPPHFHAKYNARVVEVNIETLDIIKGNFPNRARTLILEWASKHRKELFRNWNLAKAGKNPKKINPLN